jgi:hypothetical protein
VTGNRIVEVYRDQASSLGKVKENKEEK